MRSRVWLSGLLGLSFLFALAQAPLPQEQLQRYERAIRLAAQGKLREAEPLLLEIVRKHPTFAPAHLSLGLLYRLQNQHEKALMHLRRAATLNPKEPRALVELARLCLDLNRLEDAKGYLRMLQARFPNEPELPVLEGALAMLQNNWSLAREKFQQALAKRPNDFRLHYNLGIIAYQQQRYQEAERHFRQAVTLKPNYTTGWKSLGMTYEALGLPERAIHAYTEVLKREPDDLPTRFKRASLYQRLNNLEAALADYRHLAKVYPKNADAHLGAGLILMRKERYREALAHLGAVLQLVPSTEQLYFEVLTEVAYCHFHLKEYGKARAQFAEVLKRMPRNARAYEGQYQVLLAQQVEETELSPFLHNWAAHVPDDPRPLQYLARMYERNRQPQLAEETYRQLLQKFPERTELVREFAQFLMRQGREDEAVQLYDQILQQAPKDPIALLGKARYAERRQQFQQALELYQQVLAQDPSNEPALLGAAAMYRELNQPDKAIEVYRRLTLGKTINQLAFSALLDLYRRLNRTDELIGYLKEMVQCHGDSFLPFLASQLIQAGRGEEAVATLKEAVRREPKNAENYRLLGVVYETLQRHADALTAYQQAHTLDPKHTWTLYHIAKIQIQQGRKDAAWQTLVRALRIDPDDISLYPPLEQLAKELGREVEYRALIRELAQRDTPANEPLKAYVAWLRRENKVDEALALVRQRLRAKPNNTALLLLELSLLSAQQRHREALRIYAQLARLQPTNVNLLREWVSYAEQHGSLVDALQALQALYRAVPDDVAVGLKLVRHLELLGLRYRALELLRIMRDNFPTNPDVREALERMEAER
ncbi:MAG: tetratricopeptide repeat protein [Fimbriimonadales bacterium]|nr:tetratricopeptide repeat protein [Fimbriimonadales bacterium]MDW8051988.1 tetratricopeptide repeat protein [Armatimonadota bacterium]